MLRSCCVDRSTVIYNQTPVQFRDGLLRVSDVGKRGSPCTVCAHEKRHQIEIGLVHGVSGRVLGERFDLSKDAILRHARNHLSPQVRAGILAAQAPSAIDLDALRASESEGLLSQLVVQRARLQQQGDLAISLGDVSGCVAVEGKITANLALTGKLLGTLVSRHEVSHSSVLLTPDYLKLRQALLLALRPFPDAARAVGAALHLLESDAATDITARAARPAPKVIEHEPRARRFKPIPAILEPAAGPLPPPPC